MSEQSLRAFYESFQMLDAESRQRKISLFAQKIASNPQSSQVDLWLAWIDVFRGHLEIFEQRVNKCANSSDATIRAEARRLLHWLHEDRVDDASRRNALQELVAGQPGSALSHYELAEAELRSGNLHAAASAFQAALDLISVDTVEYARGLNLVASEYVRLLLRVGKRDEAVALMDHLKSRFGPVSELEGLDQLLHNRDHTT